MIDAHCEAGFTVGIPFGTDGSFDFSAKENALAGRVSKLGSTMIKHRLTPPPEEAYSLHRKLSGAFLSCKKLGATVACRDMFMDVYNAYDFDAPDDATDGGNQTHVHSQGE